MSSRLINVRLDKQRLERARRLRAEGITLSDLVRDAIDRQYEKIVNSSRPRDVAAVLQEIYDQYPDPSDLPSRKYSVHDPLAARKAISRRLHRKRS